MEKKKYVFLMQIAFLLFFSFNHDCFTHKISRLAANFQAYSFPKIVPLFANFEVGAHLFSSPAAIDIKINGFRRMHACKPLMDIMLQRYLFIFRLYLKGF